jgi:macrodomain Ter protein organizer (MatP/YcbG family)
MRMRIKVESGGKIFTSRSKQSVLKFDVTAKKVDERTYEVEIKDRIRVVTVRLPYELYERMTDYAQTNEVTISDVIRKALTEFLKKEGF